jgi:hypothetical protein
MRPTPADIRIDSEKGATGCESAPERFRLADAILKTTKTFTEELVWVGFD